MSIGTVIVGTLVFIAIALAFKSLLKTKASGKGVGCAGCSGCSSSGSCDCSGGCSSVDVDAIMRKLDE